MIDSTVPVWVIDDCSLSAKLLERMIVSSGGEVTVFTKATETASLANSGHWPLLILIDQQMPDLPGTTLCKRLRAAGYTGELALMSASPELIDENAVLGLRVDCMLRKPIELLVVGMLIRRARRLGRSAAA
jgi:DNA-binding response OmpR family regulator